MVLDQKVVVVLPAYNAGKTLEKTVSEIPFNIVDEIILVDDNSNDNTWEVAQSLQIKHRIQHQANLGYGANQKSCYKKALEQDAQIIIMLHPDYQYSPQLIYPMAHMIASGIFPVVIASRILGGGALKGGMPLYKYIANRALTFIQNILLNRKLSEYHTGYRAFHRKVLENIDFHANSNDFLFDNQMLAQIIHKGYAIGEVSCPTRYDKNSSSISFFKAIKYGAGVIKTSVQFLLQKYTKLNFNIFHPPPQP